MNSSEKSTLIWSMNWMLFVSECSAYNDFLSSQSVDLEGGSLVKVHLITSPLSSPCPRYSTHTLAQSFPNALHVWAWCVACLCRSDFVKGWASNIQCVVFDYWVYPTNLMHWRHPAAILEEFLDFIWWKSSSSQEVILYQPILCKGKS